MIAECQAVGDSGGEAVWEVVSGARQCVDGRQWRAAARVVERKWVAKRRASVYGANAEAEADEAEEETQSEADGSEGDEEESELEDESSESEETESGGSESESGDGVVR